MITDVFNYFIENSFAAFNEEKVDDHFLDIFFKENALPKYVVEDDKKIVGFGLLRKFHRAPAFDKAAELTYFILPEFAGKGIGSQLLNLLINDAKANKINNLLACISGMNEKSINFHKKHGFEICGTFKQVGRKFNTDFDLLWMQKILKS